MRLFLHPDFDQAILQAAEHFRSRRLRPAIIEKDCYVTEALRTIATAATDHYYDLLQLAAQPEVIAMLHSPEYAEIKANYDRLSRAHFPKSYFSPQDMCFARSDALFPPPELVAAIGPSYEAQCRVLCYGPFPSWKEVEARFLELKPLL